MQAQLENKTKAYFTDRTPSGQGVIKDFFELNYDASIKVRLCDNDYLNLANHPEVLEAQINHIKSCAQRDIVMSSLFLASQDVHGQLEKDMAEYFGKQCVLTQSGYAANVGLMHALCDSSTHVYADQILHASFRDGLKAQGAMVHRFLHNDAKDLEAKIKEHGPGIIIVESVYSVPGDFAPIHDVVRLKHTYGCLLVVDESHSLGIFGRRGLMYEENIDKHVDFITASLAKAYCTRAGIIIGPHSTFIKEKSYHYCFSSALMREDIIRIREIFNVVQKADANRANLMAKSEMLRNALQPMVLEMPRPSPIICFRFKSEQDMDKFHRYLTQQGILAAPFCHPGSPRNAPLLRMTVHSALSTEDVQMVIRAVLTYKNKL
ncbi:Aminotransferase, class I and II [Gongronella butleri]|nr:Aminotransferase, class I and II [Gongronella butleri]